MKRLDKERRGPALTLGEYFPSLFMRQYISFLLLGLAIQASAQSGFNYLYQQEVAVESWTAQAANGDVLLAIDSYNDTAAYFHRIIVQRLDAQGNVLNTGAMFRPPSFRLTGGIFPLSTNESMLLGTVNIPLEDADSVFVTKLDATEQIAWTKGFQITPQIHQPRGMIETSDGSYLIYGTYEEISFAEGIFLMKIAPDGSMIWSRTISSQLSGAFMKVAGIVETASGEFWLSGSTRFNSEGSWLAKLNDLGETQSVTFYNTHSLTESQPEPFAISQRSNGELDIFYNSTAFQGGSVLLAVHADASGVPINSTRFYRGNEFGEITAIQADPTGGFIAGGYLFRENAFRSSGLAMHISDNYTVDWSNRYGTDYIEIITSVGKSSNGNFVMAGFADFDSVIISPSENGLFPWIFSTDNVGQDVCFQQNTLITTRDTSFSTSVYQLDNVAGTGLGDIPFSNIDVSMSPDSVLCGPLSIEMIATDRMALFPNPATGIAIIETQGITIEHIKAFDLTGREIPISLNFNSTFRAEINTEFIGMAVVKVQTQDGFWVKKVLFRM